MAQSLDMLTGLPDRRALHTTLNDLVQRRSPIALAIIDLDGLLKINSDFGEAVGDMLIQRQAALLVSCAPGKVYRVSGDEFAMILDDMSLEQAFLRMEAVRAQIAAANDYFDLPDHRHMTASIGVAQTPRDASDASALLHAAQAALQGAKDHGRNQVGLPPNEEMIMKTCYYPASSVRRLQSLAKRLSRKESPLLREALDDLIRKYDLP